jgi:hypothetical protein
MKALTELTKDWCFSSTELSYRGGGEYFDWLSVWVRGPDLHHKLEISVCW